MNLFATGRWKFYLWVGLAYWVIRSFGGLTVYPNNPVEIVINNAWLTSYVTVVNYFLFEFTLSFFSLRKLHMFFLLLLLHFILYPFIFGLWRDLGLFTHVYTPLAEMTYFKRLESLMEYAVSSMVFFGIGKHIYAYVNLKRISLQLQIEKQGAELNYLKSQTNPHFLFNTLNNIYSLSREKSELAPESILRLSKILRYMLYETGGDFIAVEQELKIINDYIALEKLRYDETLKVTFHSDIENMGQPIPPLLLIPLIENAFKHGASESVSQPFVDIHLSIKNQLLTLIVKNSVDEMEGTVVKENIGLSNLRRQLALLYKDATLSVTNSGNVFIATLQINLASHV
jgi:two-component system, LytTR family, sensor kinase